MEQLHFQQSKQIAKVATAGDNDPNVNSHLGAVYKFFARHRLYGLRY